MGEFIADFGHLEGWLFSYLCERARISTRTGQALLSGAKTDTLTSYIKRLHEAKAEEIHPLMARAIEQMGHLNALRNKLVHYPAWQEGADTFVVTTATRQIPSRATKTPVKISAIDDAIFDLTTIGAIIAILNTERRVKRGLSRGRVTDDEEAAIIRRAHVAWRYTPPIPASLRQTNPSRPQEPLGQQLSSHAKVRSAKNARKDAQRAQAGVERKKD